MDKKSPLFPTSLKVVFIVWLALLSNSALALSRIQPTAIEWDSWPRLCKAAGHTNVEPPLGRSRPTISKQERALIWKVGGWHYCMGYLKVQRLELMTVTLNRKDLLRQALGDILYSFKRIAKTEPWAAEMAVTYARALRLADKNDQAIEVLDEIKPLHPKYGPIYTAYTALYFDNEEYDKAVAVLEEGNRATGDSLGELQYFLGLAYFKSGNIEQARVYEQKARENEYPLRFLTRKLAEYDAKQ